MSKDCNHEERVMKIWKIKIAAGYRGDNYHKSGKLPEITGKGALTIHWRKVVLSGSPRSPYPRGCKDTIGGGWLSSVWVRVCSAERTKDTYPDMLTVIHSRSSMYLKVALSGPAMNTSCRIIKDLVRSTCTWKLYHRVWFDCSHIWWESCKHTKSVDWFIDALTPMINPCNEWLRQKKTNWCNNSSVNEYASKQ